MVLRSRCPPDAGPKACAGAPAELMRCSKPADCKAGEDCLKGQCVACDKGGCNVCPPGTQERKVLNGNCVACKCVPECQFHEQCPIGTACVAGSCTDCPVPAVCPAKCELPGWSPQKAVHNGCTMCECAPPTECMKDAECGAGLVCYAGQQCDDGCTTPDCCRGNLCGAPGCKAPAASSCGLVGCPKGRCVGDPACKPSPCKCVRTSDTDIGWVCGEPCEAMCQ